MQTFLPYPLYSSSAKCLDYRRLGKQRVECLQILQCLSGEKGGWKNHPAVKMWEGFEKSLAIYGLFICTEWIARGYKDTCFDKIQKYIPSYHFTGDRCIDYSGLSKEHPTPKWLGNERFHSAHRSALLIKDYNWYSQFNWKDEPKLDYFWPSKNNI
jgi:hypothetical protein